MSVRAEIRHTSFLLVRPAVVNVELSIVGSADPYAIVWRLIIQCHPDGTGHPVSRVRMPSDGNMQFHRAVIRRYLGGTRG